MVTSTLMLKQNMTTASQLTANSVTPFQDDLRIPVPWGYLSAKVWGQKDGLPVLALHGWQDNASSFDTLAPLLPQEIHLVCLDFCGHGWSSHYPPDMFLNYCDHVYHVKLVVDFLKWDRFIIMAHSMGAIIALHFTSMFPERVSKLISLDIVAQTSTPPEVLPFAMRRVIDDFESLNAKIKRDVSKKTTTLEMARNKLLQTYEGSINENSANCLLTRALRKTSNDEYEYTRDLRTVIPPYIFGNYTIDQLKAVTRAIRCPYLLIKVRGSITAATPDTTNLPEEALKVYGQMSEDFRYVELDGTHHIHLNQPEIVAPYIKQFILSLPHKIW